MTIHEKIERAAQESLANYHRTPVMNGVDFDFMAGHKAAVNLILPDYERMQEALRSIADWERSQPGIPEVLNALSPIRHLL